MGLFSEMDNKEVAARISEVAEELAQSIGEYGAVLYIGRREIDEDYSDIWLTYLEQALEGRPQFPFGRLVGGVAMQADSVSLPLVQHMAMFAGMIVAAHEMQLSDDMRDEAVDSFSDLLSDAVCEHTPAFEEPDLRTLGVCPGCLEIGQPNESCSVCDDEIYEEVSLGECFVCGATGRAGLPCECSEDSGAMFC
jgi:hypothetical protein